VRIADKTVEIFHKGKRIASHARAPTRTLPQEPPSHPNRTKSGPLPLAGVSSIEADRRP
jgi:hypothetical protein